MKVILCLLFILVKTVLLSGDELRISEEKNVIIFGSNKPGIYLFRNAKSHSYLDIEFIDSFNYYKGKANIEFVISDLKEEIEKRTSSVLKVMPKDLPIIKLYDTSSDDVREYTMTEEINKENIIKFINNSLKVTDESIRQDL